MEIVTEGPLHFQKVNIGTFIILDVFFFILMWRNGFEDGGAENKEIKAIWVRVFSFL